MSRPVEVGDFVDISIENVGNRYVIYEIRPPYIIIYPIDNPSQKNAVISTDKGWKVYLAENQPFEIRFIAKTISETEAADICSNFVLRRTDKIDDDTLIQLKAFASSEKLQVSENSRVLCDNILKSIVSRENPDLNVERINVQNLARQYEHNRDERKKREEELRKIEQENKRRLNLISLVTITKEEIVKEEINTLKNNYMDQNICLNIPRFEDVELVPFINERLHGHRVSIPARYWTMIFNPQSSYTLTNIQQIQQEVFNITREIPENWPDEFIIDVLGRDRVREITGVDFSDPNRPTHLQLKLGNLTTYAVISEFHTDDNFIHISQLIASELEDIHSPIKLVDCALDSVAVINLKLLRSPNSEEVDPEIVKTKLVDRFSDLGILIIGDILTINIDERELTYYIQKLATVNEREVFAASLPTTDADVRIVLSFETKEELKEKLQGKISEPIDDDLI